MGRKAKTGLAAAPTDAHFLSTAIAGAPPERNGNGGLPENHDLARQILEQRRVRLERQNKKLDIEISRQEEAWGSITELKNDVRRMNAVVRQSLYAMAGRISEPLALMDDPTAIRDVLRDELTAAFRDLAYEDGAGPSSA
jgi:hypothetical protein